MSLEMTGSDILVRSLAEEGVEHVFGYPGGAVLYIYDAIYKQDKFKHILVRHEQAAVHAADAYARSSGKVGVALVMTAVLLFFSDMASNPRRPSPPAKTAESRNGISYWQALAVGIGQAFAVVPGLSRSGTTISVGLICGVRRDVMAQFSFLMVLVPILGEAFLQVVGGELTGSALGAWPVLLGFVSAFLSGLFACKVMIALVKKARLTWFALYCAIAALCIFIFG